MHDGGDPSWAVHCGNGLSVVTDMDAMIAKQIKRTNKPLWYPSQKNTKADKNLPKEVSEHVIIARYLHLVPGNIQYHLKSAVSEFLAKGGQITKCAVGTKKP